MINDDLGKQFPSLRLILGAYLNQDYTLCGPNLEDAVSAFIDDSTHDQIIALRAEIAKFLSVKANNLDAELNRLDSGYACEPDMNAHDYLLWLDGLLAEGLAKKLPEK